MSHRLFTPLLAACALCASAAASAVPIVEAGATVERADFSLYFSSVFSGRDLGQYEEGGVFVTTQGTAYTGFAPFAGDARTEGYHYAASGNHGYTSIRGVNSEVFGAADFLFGNGWAAPHSYLGYATYLDGRLTGAGVARLAAGTVRISELGGFDELRLNASFGAPAAFGDYQAIALDDLNLQSWTAQVPEPATLILCGAAVLGCVLAGRKRPD